MTGYTTGPANQITSDGTWNYFSDANGNVIQKVNIGTGQGFCLRLRQPESNYGGDRYDKFGLADARNIPV